MRIKKAILILFDYLSSELFVTNRNGVVANFVLVSFKCFRIALRRPSSSFHLTRVYNNKNEK